MMRSQEEWDSFVSGSMKGLWDWSPFDECFDRGVRFSDLDGIIDDNGRFLIIEGKPSDGLLSKGQKILFRRLSDLPQFTVLIVFGNPPKNYGEWLTVDGRASGEGIDSLREFISDWWRQ